MAGKPSPRPKYLTSAGESIQCIKKPRLVTGASVSRVMDKLEREAGRGAYPPADSTLWPRGCSNPIEKAPRTSELPLPKVEIPVLGRWREAKLTTKNY
jgi:hypothetical protein